MTSAENSQALDGIGANDQYRLIGGVSVMLHIRRLGLDLPLRAADETFVIFADRSLRYCGGEGAGRAEAAAFGRSVGVPDTQLDREK